MQKKSAGSGILIGVGGDDKDGAAKIWGQLVVGLLRNFKNRILEGWLSLGEEEEEDSWGWGSLQDAQQRDGEEIYIDCELSFLLPFVTFNLFFYFLCTFFSFLI